MAASDLVISVGANIQQLERQMKAAAKVAEQRADEIEGVFRKANPTLVGDFGLGVLKGAIAAISFERITRGFTDANKEIASFGDTARRVGLDLAKFQELRLAAQGQGIAGKDFDAGIQSLAKTLNEARREENELTKLLDANGVKYRDRKGEIISTNEALAVAADLISRAGTEQDKLAIAEKLGIPSDFLPLLEGGADALSKLGREAAAAGMILDSDVIAKAKEFDAAWAAVWAAFESNAKGSIVRAGQFLADLGAQADRIAKSIGNSGIANSLNQAMRSAFPEGYKDYDRQQRANFRQSELRSQEDSGPLVVTVRKSATKIPVKSSGRGGGGGSGAKSEDEQAQDRLDRYIESLVRQRAVMEAEAATVGKSNAERKAAVEIAKAQVDLEKLGTAAKAEYIAKLTEEVGKNEEVRASKERLQQAQQGLNDAQKYFGNAAVDALEDLIINGEKAEDVVKRLAASLAKAALQALLIGEGPLAGLFGMKGVGGGAGGLLGGINLFGRATGGPVNAGQPYRVGERGPETFVPTTPGKIIPAGRSGGLTVNPTYQIDARGSQMSEAQFRAILSENNAALKAEMPGYLGKLQQRGGT